MTRSSPELVQEAGKRRKRFVAWSDGEDAPADPLLEDLIARGDTPRPRPAGREGPRRDPDQRHDRHAEGRQPQPARVAAAGRRLALEDPAALRASRGWSRRRCSTPGASRTSRSGWRWAPRWSCGRRFDPEETLSAIAQHECTALAVVPVMLSADPRAAGRDASTATTPRSLRVIGASGSALPGPLATEVMDRFGDVLYNLYGSTEVAWATIAQPADLRAAPGTAGRPPFGHDRAALDDDGREVAEGRDGPHLRRQRAGLRRLHRRRQQGDHRRPDVDRRRRPLRRRRPPVHRRPRRRDDRLGRRERLPARGRGPAEPPRRGRGGRGRGRRRRRSSASG